MNKIFGFFKQKIVEAKVQNKKQFDSLVNVLSGDDTGYKSQIILSHLQKIKANYMTWSILIANEASTGLYYSQIHNHSVCLKKAITAKEIQANVQKYSIVQKQMKKTHEQLKQIGDLSDKWVNNMSQKMEAIKKIRQRKKSQQKSQKSQIVSNLVLSVQKYAQFDKQADKKAKISQKSEPQLKNISLQQNLVKFQKW